MNQRVQDLVNKVLTSHNNLPSTKERIPLVEVTQQLTCANCGKYENPFGEHVPVDFSNMSLVEGQPVPVIEAGAVVMYNGSEPLLVNHVWGIRRGQSGEEFQGWVKITDIAGVRLSDPRQLIYPTDVLPLGHPSAPVVASDGKVVMIQRTVTVSVVAD